jgi:hypothetical protein
VVWPQNHSNGFTDLASKPVATVSDGLSSKSAVMVFSGLASKLVAMVFSSLASKLLVTVSPCLTSKPTIDFLVEPQNQSGGGFSGFGLKTGSSGLVIWATFIFHFHISRVKVCHK